VKLWLSAGAKLVSTAAFAALFFLALTIVMTVIAVFALSESPQNRWHIRRRLVGLPIIAFHTVLITLVAKISFWTGSFAPLSLVAIFLPQAWLVWRILLFPRQVGGGGWRNKRGPDNPVPSPSRPPSISKPVPGEFSRDWRKKAQSQKFSSEFN
jgi:uncharacterized SAM-binding protein YcdF (DUF218 family)